MSFANSVPKIGTIFEHERFKVLSLEPPKNVYILTASGIYSRVKINLLRRIEKVREERFELSTSTVHHILHIIDPKVSSLKIVYERGDLTRLNYSRNQ